MSIQANSPMDEKLQKVLAHSGVGSRREMERWIEAGRIKVNNELATLGDRVSAADDIQVDGKPLKRDTSKKTRRILIYNKPDGEVCTRNDPEGRQTVFDRLPKLKGERWIAVGRLDINTSGLLIFTTDGELANKLMHPSTSNIDREYAVRIAGNVDDAMIKRLKTGVALEDGMAKFTDVKYFSGEGFNQWYHVVLMEGRNREVRRLWESQEVQVSRLKRVRYGCVFLSSRLATGKWQELNQKEANELADLAGEPRLDVPRLAGEDRSRYEREERKMMKAPSRQIGRNN
jgi:23S rRNA pseudouridine2605 synthase